MVRGDKGDVLEVFEVGIFGEFVEEGVLELGGIGHGELRDALAFLPGVEVPETSVDDLRVVGEVAEMGAGE